ncbi:lytic polysaccharide monooxygenase [Polychaeton citri CBS 116435]|uniref:Lytic polysaccharide monooxygenase n=1 Tax=Polychaeton citri CBS 116435 TaxID=1314669 RepID=A0A9P4PZC1_9PEZI|nr:lytic polysaccharide monooxygenase [Polychaeton citri CBS 116435]
MVNYMIALLALAGSSMGHLIMDSPIPFGRDSLNNSPLVDAKPGTSQSDFPCKQRQGVYDITAMNNMAVGDAQELNFTGSASHGGGTCQIAVTLDHEPDAKSVWKIIQVFEGGCPIDADGNSGTHPFSFSIPEKFPNGRASLAWVWYNRIGNREIYMNCAPITVTGGSDDKSFFDTLPNLYVINLPTSECSSQESVDQLIPFPGQFVMRENVQSIKAASGPQCAASAAAMTQDVKAYQSATSNDGGAYKAPATNGDSVGPAPTGGAAASSSVAAAAPTSAMGGAGSSAASSGAAPASSASATSSFPTLTPSAGAGVGDGGSAAPTGTMPANPNSTGGSCSGDDMICDASDPSKFGLCSEGRIVWQPVAPGTQCKGSAIVKAKRGEIAHLRRHLAGRRRSVAAT